MIKRITDHAKRTLSLIPSRLRGASLLKLVEGIAGELQALEDVVWGSIVDRFLSTAKGVQLDQYGLVLGVKRGGLDDDDYRVLLGVTILANRSSGEPNRLIRIAQILLEVPVRYSPIYPAGFRLDYSTSNPISATRQRLTAEIIGRTRPSGVGLEGIFESLDPVFAFDDDPTADPDPSVTGFDEGFYAEDIFMLYGGD